MSTSAPSGDGGEASHEERCMLLHRELRLYCQDGLRDEKASANLDCLSRRLELRKRCE